MLIVTDGAVDLPPRLSTSEGVRVVRGKIWVEDQPFRDDETAFWSLLRSGLFPATTPPTVTALAEAYCDGPAFCAVHVSGDLSATVSHGHRAAAQAGVEVTLIDTRSLSVGAGIVVGAIRHVADDPEHAAFIVAFARSLPERLHTFVLIQEAPSLRQRGASGAAPTASHGPGPPALARHKR